MKKLFLLVLLVAATGSSHAQSIAAGTVSLGGSIGYNRSTTETIVVIVTAIGTNTSKTYTATTTSSQFSFSPAVGYFLADNLELGLDLGYTVYSRPYISYASSNTQPELDPATTLRVGAFGRYYKMFGEQFGVTGMVSVGYQTLRDHAYNTSGIGSGLVTDYKASGYYAAITPGIVFFPIPRLGISASIGSLGYNRTSSDNPASLVNPAPTGFERKASTFGARFGLDQLQFGGTYYFGR